MLPWFTKLITAAAVVLASTFIFTRFSSGFRINSVLTPKTDSFKATGEGKATAIPNLATINLGVQIQKPTVKETQDEANRILNAITQSLKDQGIDKKDIQTTNYYLNPNIDYSNNSRRINGYSLNSDLEVKVRDFDKLNAVIDTGTKQGANQVGAISFGFDDNKRKELENEAREKAVKAAKNKAIDLAKITGITLGRIIDVQENGNFPSPRMYDMYTMAITKESASPSTNLQPGEGQISTTITLTYETR